jgi:hypothetical protein
VWHKVWHKCGARTAEGSDAAAVVRNWFALPVCVQASAGTFAPHLPALIGCPPGAGGRPPGTGALGALASKDWFLRRSACDLLRCAALTYGPQVWWVVVCVWVHPHTHTHAHAHTHTHTHITHTHTLTYGPQLEGPAQCFDASDDACLSARAYRALDQFCRFDKVRPWGVAPLSQPAYRTAIRTPYLQITKAAYDP